MNSTLLWAVTGLLVLLGLLAFLRLGTDPSDPRQHLRAVKRAGFEARPVLNRSEMTRLVWFEEWARGKPYRVLAQVPYGEMMRTKEPAAFRAVNAKRADFLVIDAAGLPLVAIEYQGEGHYQGDAKARDAVKRAALARANIALVELFPEDDRTEAIAAIEAALSD
ncbi:DUF2726 domain-containing protein [Parvularcula dongshanensis]|uniref:DUF2726 domain-containing protein n=1 Tax=Parvularcula dongshanensis TaxID=1173995 RepID=A0A840I487_9PROT|nr:DUF2726 domain-containing protein [Parvularcula dongshanensis]MBB4659145.1 hypothetical protein [Parvularcula dongshanensis]